MKYSMIWELSVARIVVNWTLDIVMRNRITLFFLKRQTEKELIINNGKYYNKSILVWVTICRQWMYPISDLLRELLKFHERKSLIWWKITGAIYIINLFGFYDIKVKIRLTLLLRLLIITIPNLVEYIHLVLHFVGMRISCLFYFDYFAEVGNYPTVTFLKIFWSYF